MNFVRTLKNGRAFYKRDQYYYSAEIFKERGFVARLNFTDRTYEIFTRVDMDAQMVIMEISPHIYCCKESRSQVGEYIDKINSKYKSCNIRITPNGNLHVHAEQRFDESPVSEEMYGIMEGECLRILSTFETVLDKLAHLKLLEPDEADPEKMIAKHMEDVKAKVAEMDIDELFDDDIDYDEDDELLIREPRFSEWLRKKKADAKLPLPVIDDSAEEKISRPKKEESSELSDEQIDNLLESLLAVRDEFEHESSTSANKETEESEETEEDED